MADHQSSRTYDLDPSVTSALGAAYDSVLLSLQSEGTEFLRFALACDLMNAAFAGESDPGRLRERGITFVRSCLHPPCRMDCRSSPRGDCMSYKILTGKPLGSTGSTATTASEALRKGEELAKHGMSVKIVTKDRQSHTVDEFKAILHNRRSEGVA